MRIGNYLINKNSPVFIIAELSANHNGSIETALETVRAAKRAGANCIKLQTFTADTITLKSKKEDFKINQGTIWDNQYLHDLYKKTSLPWEWHKKIMDVASAEGLVCFSSPFDRTSVEFLEKLNVPAYKIASFEITDIPLIELVASKNKPVIISTGVAEEKDIRLALEACKRMGNDKIILLKCTSSYPAPIEEANICMIQDFSKRFNVFSGLSDHTLGSSVPIAATVLGARVIEKHFILDRSVGGADSSFSMNELEFTEMVKSIREAENAIGKVDYSLTEKQKKGREFSRSLYIVEDVSCGEILTNENVRSIRPGYGLHPKYLTSILGKRFVQDFERGTALTNDMVI